GIACGRRFRGHPFRLSAGSVKSADEERSLGRQEVFAGRRRGGGQRGGRLVASHVGLWDSDARGPLEAASKACGCHRKGRHAGGGKGGGKEGGREERLRQVWRQSLGGETRGAEQKQAG